MPRLVFALLLLPLPLSLSAQESCPCAPIRSTISGVFSIIDFDRYGEFGYGFAGVELLSREASGLGTRALITAPLLVPLLLDVAVGPAFSADVGRRVTLVPHAGLAVLMALGGQAAFGPEAGLGLMVRTGRRGVVSLTWSRRWLRNVLHEYPARQVALGVGVSR